MTDFTPGESQRAVAALAAQVLDGDVLASGGDPWKELAKAGLLTVGDDGLGVLDVTTLLAEIGRRAPQVAMKALATLMTGALPVLRWGGEELRRATLPAVASGELIMAAATTAAIPYAGQASLILVPAPGGVALVDPRSAGVTLTRTPTSSGYPAFILQTEARAEAERAPAGDMLGGPDCLADLQHLAVAGACALLDGAVAGALALTRDHVATRRQFGRPLAEFQAVSQQIAEVYIASRTMHLATLSACWRLSEDRDPGADLAVAGYWCAEQASRAVRLCHHLHGGLGMDVTYPLHRFSALVADLTRYLGGAEYRLGAVPAGAPCSST